MAEYLVYFDCGTTNSRIYVLDSSLREIARDKIAKGSKDAAISKESAFIAKQLKALYDATLEKLDLQDKDVKAIYASGMATSPYGIHEVPHLLCPLSFDSYSKYQVPFAEDLYFKRTINLIPGIRTKNEDFSLSGNTRGEEIEALGAAAILKKMGISDVAILFPGSHTHAIRIKDGAFSGISSNFTGEIFHALWKETILNPILSIRTPEKLSTEMIDLALENLERFGFNRALYICHAMRIMGERTEEERFSYAEGVINGGLRKSIEWSIENLWKGCRTLAIAGDEFNCNLLEAVFHGSPFIDRIVSIKDTLSLEGFKRIIGARRKRFMFDLEKELMKLCRTGGGILLTRGTHDVGKPLSINTSCTKLSGEVWNYPNDPNGVFESDFGTKLRLRGHDYPAILVGAETAIGGVEILDLGIQGDITGMDTRPLFQIGNPDRSAGLAFKKGRVDQAEFSKLSFTGLSVAVTALDKAELDACSFSRLNTDGCAVGVFLSPQAACYNTFSRSVMADTPYWGFYAKGRGRAHHLFLDSIVFARNGGAFTQSADNAASVYIEDIDESAISNCVIDYPGHFWFYEAESTANSDRKMSARPTPALILRGNCNRIANNEISHTTDASMIIEGNHNLVIGNMVSSDVYVSGNDNHIANLLFTNPDAKLHIRGKGNQIFGVKDERIIQEN